MPLRSVTQFLAVLATIVLVIAGIGALKSPSKEAQARSLAGDWRLAHQVLWGPFKNWTFEYRLRLWTVGDRLHGEGETIAVNGQPPKPEEQTTLQVVDGMLRGGNVLAWVFERNGDRAGRGAMRWRPTEDGLLVGTFVTTFYRGVSVGQRAFAAEESGAPAPQSDQGPGPVE